MSIEIKNLTYTYGAGSVFEKTALKNINLSIPSGAFVGLIGHTGSGKSTLMQHLNALLRPTEGDVFVDDENIFADKGRLKAIRQKVGLVFQYPEHQLFEMTVYKDVAFGPENLGLSEAEVKSRVEEALETVGMGKESYEKSPFELSGGQKRRVAIAGVLAMKPKVLVLDEPAAGLDPRGSEEILEQIRRMHDTLNITVILVSHSMEHVAKLVDRIIVINQGVIAMDGSPQDVFSRGEELESMGLAAPQAANLMKALQNKGFNLPNGVYTVEQAADALYSFLK